MERLVVKCTPKNRQETGCIVEGKCEHMTRNGYCGYHDCFNEKGVNELLSQLDRLGQLEDEAERRERGCGECIRKSCDICTSKIYNYVCDECDDYSNYEPMNYCPTCGRKLVK